MYGNKSILIGNVSSLLQKGIDKKLSYEKKASDYIKGNSDWDGVVHLFSSFKNSFPTGYIIEVVDIIKQYAKYMGKEYTLSFKDMRKETCKN